jgi:tetratricopeptide (TPR) repeat protein
VTAPVLRGARFALDAARPAVARLDTSRGPEDLAADLIETWSAVEAALRSLVGSTTLSGQPLIREARGRQMINFDQANALAEFQAVHDRVQSTTYHPTDADVKAARSAFLKLDSALLGDAGGEPVRAAPGVSPRAAAEVVTTTPIVAETPPPTQSMLVAPPPRFPPWMLAAFGVLIVAVIAIGGYFIFGHRGSSSLQQGVDAYTRGQREVAVNAFNKAVRDDPKDPLPHIYLARMAREVGNFSLASQELQLALQADPNNALALREMGADLLAQGNYELARRFYIRAVQANPTDKSAQGYLGCTLMRLGRVPEGTTFLNRAGPGPWTGCTPVANPNAQNAIPGQSPLQAQPLTNNPRP